MAFSHPPEADNLLYPATTNYPPTAHSSVDDSLGTPRPGYGEYVESRHSSLPLRQSYDPYHDDTPPHTRTPSQDAYNENEHIRGLSEKRYSAAGAGYTPPKSSGKRRLFWLMVALAGLAVIAAAVVIPIYFKVIKPNNRATQSLGNSPGSPGSTQPGSPGTVPQSGVSGGDGSTVNTETGSMFVYNNSFGGFWYYDPADPFKNNAQAQSWTPPLNTSWKWGVDKIYGVNLGGWLVLEPFITPAIFEPYVNNTNNPAIDEWSLCTNLAADASSGGVAKVIEDHYKTFITEQDFAQIAGAGLNWVRIPFPFWAIEVYPGEPFLEKVAWKYFLKAISWARKYGLRINLDLHTMPGSQNGYNHSGKQGTIGWHVLNGTMGIANAQRSLNYIRTVTQFISQPQYRDVIPMIGVVNEALPASIGKDVMDSFYLEVYNIIRNITGFGEGHGPWISIHEGFLSLPAWTGYMPGNDRISLDAHLYLTFTDQDLSPITSQTEKPCAAWGSYVNKSMSDFGMTTVGEFSNGMNDCGWFLNGVNRGARYDGTFSPYGGPRAGPGACLMYMDISQWNDTVKAAVKRIALGNMDALQNWFFWTWKVGESLTWGTVASPMWSYKLGLDNGFMPTDPREAIGTCGNTAPWQGPLPPSKVGGAGAGPIDPDYVAAHPWPPTTLSGGLRVATLPTYTPTQTPITLTPATYTATADPGSGWFNTADQGGFYTPIAGCAYPNNAWEAVTATETVCRGSAQRVLRGRNIMPRETGVPG